MRVAHTVRLTVLPNAADSRGKDKVCICRPRSAPTAGPEREADCGGLPTVGDRPSQGCSQKLCKPKFGVLPRSAFVAPVCATQVTPVARAFRWRRSVHFVHWGMAILSLLIARSKPWSAGHSTCNPTMLPNIHVERLCRGMCYNAGHIRHVCLCFSTSDRYHARRMQPQHHVARQIST